MQATFFNGFCEAPGIACQQYYVGPAVSILSRQREANPTGATCNPNPLVAPAAH
jgi:hypothetical protein